MPKYGSRYKKYSFHENDADIRLANEQPLTTPTHNWKVQRAESPVSTETAARAQLRPSLSAARASICDSTNSLPLTAGRLHSSRLRWTGSVRGS